MCVCVHLLTFRTLVLLPDSALHTTESGTQSPGSPSLQACNITQLGPHEGTRSLHLWGSVAYRLPVVWSRHWLAQWPPAASPLQWGQQYRQKKLEDAYSYCQGGVEASGRIQMLHVKFYNLVTEHITSSYAIQTHFKPNLNLSLAI